jgi:hypothetical protein
MQADLILPHGFRRDRRVECVPPTGIGRGIGLSFTGRRIGPAFTPATRNPALWLETDVGIVHTGPVFTSWTDQSSSHFVTTIDSAPAYLVSNAGYNNKPTLTFASNKLEIAAFTVSQPNTIYLVADNAAVVQNVIDGSSSRQIVGADGSQNWYGQALTQLVSTAPTISKSAVAVIFNGVSSKIYQNSSAAANASGDTGTNALTGLIIGNTSFGMNGNMAAIIITNSADTPAQIGQMFRYLSRWGGSWS